jgi:Zn-dependent M28 family amino/carboxypeptidase
MHNPATHEKHGVHSEADSMIDREGSLVLPFEMMGRGALSRVVLLCAVIGGAVSSRTDTGDAMDTPSYLRLAVTTLSREIGSRPYDDAVKLDRTVKFIGGEFASAGLVVSYQSFTYRNRQYQNVIGELKGRAMPEKVLVVGAHYDTVRTTPGADDNASGIAGLMGIARLLAGRSLDRTVRFVAFALEEPPVYRSRNMGSYHYAESLVKKRETVEGMICLEMIGFFSDREGSQHYPLPFMKLKFPKVGNYISLVGNRRSRKFTHHVADSLRNATDLPVITLNAPAIIAGIDFSDHWSFNKFRIPACMATDTAFYRNPNYHAPTDLPETLDYTRMAKVVEGLVAAVEAWGGHGRGIAGAR